MDPRHPSLDCLSDLWREIARRVFRSGDYDPHTEALAHRELTGASVRDSYLIFDNKYALALLGGRAAGLPAPLTRALLSRLCRGPRPRYPLSDDWRSPARRRVDYSTRVLTLLARVRAD